MIDVLHSLEQIAGELVAELERRFPYAAALITDTSGIHIHDTGGEQNAGEATPSRGIVFTVYDGASFEEYAAGSIAPGTLDVLAHDVRGWARGLAPVTSDPQACAIVGAGHATLAGRDTREFHTLMQIDPATVPLVDKLAHVRYMQQRAQVLDRRIVQAQVNYSDTTTDSIYIGRGRHLRQRITRTLLAALVAVSDGATVRHHYLLRGGAAGHEVARITDNDLRHLADVALRLLEAGKVEPGEYEIVTDPSVSGVIAHECFGHGVELDLFPKGRARAAHYLNRQVAARTLQMYDDPGISGAFGAYFFDDEGELARPTQILRDGVLVRPISDFASATYAPGIHTANGRRQDITRKPYARMSNTFFAPGASAPDDIIAGVERGIYLRQAESGMEDPMGWGVQVTAHYGEEIVAGRLTGRLFTPVGISGNVSDLLRSISAIGDDFELHAGFCGKGHKELVPVSTGGPHLRMKARLG
ncbi:MAG TPA: TldD/PmbA family protein [Ktedonobacterales bacterium]